MKKLILSFQAFLFFVFSLPAFELGLGAGLELALPADPALNETALPGILLSANGSDSWLFTEVYSLYLDTGGLYAFYPGTSAHNLEGILRLDFSSRFENFLHLLSFSSYISGSSLDSVWNGLAAMEQKFMFYPGEFTVSLEPSLLYRYSTVGSFSAGLTLGVFPPGVGSLVGSPYFGFNFQPGAEGFPFALSVYADFMLASSPHFIAQWQMGLIYDRQSTAGPFWNLFWTGDLVFRPARNTGLIISLPGSLIMPSEGTAMQTVFVLSPAVKLIYNFNTRLSCNLNMEADLALPWDQIPVQPVRISLEGQYALF